MAAQGELVLLAPPDAVTDRQVLGRHAHHQGRLAVAVKVARADIDACLHRDVVHVLDTARDQHFLAVGGDALGGLVHRLQAGAAVAVDGDAADRDREARDEGRHAGDVEALFAFLFDAAPVHVFDRRGRYVGALH